MELRHRICPFCEATCGLELDVDVATRSVRGIRGNETDVLSHGYLCPKGVALRELDTDPDRLHEPLVLRDGRHVAVSWQEAFEEVARRLAAVTKEHGPDAVAIYLGNPVAHKMSLGLYAPVLIRALRTSQRYSASTVDQMPKQIAAGLMFGTMLSVPVPDIDRCDLLVVLGGNPMASNGSLWTVPDFRGRLKRMQARGGRLVVVDPRRSETAERADRHLAIRPGSDAMLLAGLAHVLCEDASARLGHLADHVAGLDVLQAALKDFAPERVASACDLEPEAIRTLAAELATTPRAAVYGRIGTCTQRFGTTASWLVDVVNVLAGNLDRVGGAMFTRAAAFASNTLGESGRGRGVRIGRRQSRVRRLPEVAGEFPVATLADEIETPGEGQVRALVCIAGNPTLSTPNSGRLAAALERLDLMVSVDIYLNETSRFADVILPGLSPLEEGHYDVALSQLAVRNAARFSPPIFQAPAARPSEWEILLRLAAIASGQPPDTDVAPLDDQIVALQVRELVSNPHANIHGRDPEEILAALAPRRGPERLLDLGLRTGPWGDGFGSRPDGLSLARLEATPDGVDLGALEPRVPECLRTPSGCIELAPELLVADLARVRSALEEPAGDELLLVGRRHVRSNNSWMHNLPLLARGPFRCTLQMNPADAQRRGLRDGGRARVRSRVGEVEALVEVWDGMRPGVVSLPHGWGHDRPGTHLAVASERPGTNSNVLADELEIDPLSGNAVLNGIPVEVEALA